MNNKEQKFKFYEIFIEKNYAICIKANKKPSKIDVYNYLKEYEKNAKKFDFSIDDIKKINEIPEKKAYDLYDMEYINTLPILTKIYYVVICEYNVDGENGVDIIGIREDFEEAKILYQEQLTQEEQNAENNGYDYIDKDETSFTAYIDGDYMENHISLYIQKVEE